ncbi:hypothetical protein SG34_024340 [Thalassomonas viridans]|uniref:BACON domain-containing protein n=1 Tax=Thalassomonas viridans TaxID=137584 RepID=A0AAE9Z094_9GAMM|nr:hypothetical protein [Thalassomonas viridans]WDE04431.1 hypothetical protein SG34_024340 [Thalassomonas viridans]
MKGPRLTITQLFSLFGLVLLLQACGGSGNNAPTFTISADASKVSFSTEAGKASEQTLAVNVTFDGEGLLVGYSPDATSTGWLNYRTENVSATSATIYIDVITEFDSENGPVYLPQGLYNSRLRLSTGSTADRNLAHHDIDVSLLVWQLMSFGETFGAQISDSQTVSLVSNGETLTAGSDVNWLTVETQVDADNTNITVTPDLSGFTAAGLYQGNITVTGTNGEMSFPVEFGLDNLYLFADDNNLAFSSMPGTDALERTITISSNSLSPYNWQASTEASWLTLDQAADTNRLTITADPAMAIANAVNNTSITITSTGDDNLVAETVSVSLYNSDTTSENSTISALAINNNALVNAPLQPYVYVGINNELRVYHLYSNELITSVAISPEDTLLEQLVLHPQGHLLLAHADETVVDENEQEQTLTHRYQIDLSDISAITASELSEGNIISDPMMFARFSGRYFVVTQALEVADLNLQQLYWDSSDIFAAAAIEQAGQTGGLFALDATNGTLRRYDAKTNDFTDSGISLSLSHNYRPESLAESDNISDFVVTADEANIYLISPTSQWLSFDGTDFTDRGLLDSDSNKTDLAIAISQDNKPHFARFVPALGYFIDIYDNQQTLVTSTATLGDFPGTIAISADNRRVLVNSRNSDNSNNIEFINLVRFVPSTTGLTFTGILGESISSQTVTITNIGENWQATTAAPWLTLTQDNSEAEAQLDVAIDTSIITNTGSDSSTITLTDPDNNTSTTITVELTVTEN